MKAVNLFLGADLRSGHPGLTKLAKSRGIVLKELRKGEAVIFVNSKKDKMKAFAWNGVLSYIRFDDAKRSIDLSALDEFPRAFNADGSMDYTRALKASLEKRLARPGRVKELEVL